MENREIKIYSEAELVETIKTAVQKILRDNLYEQKLEQSVMERLLRQKQELRQNLKGAGTGDAEAKAYMIRFIEERLYSAYNWTETTIDETYFFCGEGRKNVAFLFDRLLYILEKKFQDAAFVVMMESIEGTETKRSITEEDIRRLYQIYGRNLSFAEKLELLSYKIYAAYKGLGIIDQLRDMRIDGVSGGVSGKRGEHRNVWVFYKGRSVHLEFLEFASEEEVERICRNLCRYRQPGEISRKKGYLIHEMADHARVVVARPDFAENWMFFIRKLDNLLVCDLDELITQENCELPKSLLKWLMKGCQVTGVTGMQGCGKTTLLMAMVGEIPEEYTIRVLEQAFELHLRERYEKRNIVTFRETASVDGFEGLEVQKKTDGAVSIIGEVASARVAAWMIESGQTGSLFSIFTHHAKTTRALVYSLRNSLLKEGNFESERIALAQVVEVVRFDVHLHMNRKGERYIASINEIVPRPEREEGFVVRPLIAFEKGKYVQKGRISETVRREIEGWLTEAEREEFANADI